MLALAPLTSTPEFNALAAKAKDCGSAAVFVALLTLGGAWLALAGPALWSRMGYSRRGLALKRAGDCARSILRRPAGDLPSA